MAKKKLKNTTNNAALNIGYSGTIVVKTAQADKVIDSVTYHNSGTTNLFKFICSALMGAPANELRPCRIKLYTARLSGVAEEQAGNKTTWNFTDSLLDASPHILYDVAALSQKKQDTTLNPKLDESPYTITYTFKIPYSFISQPTIYKVALFGPKNDNDILAYYGFTQSEGTGTDKTISWAPKEVQSGASAGNYSLIIEWTLKVSNNKEN